MYYANQFIITYLATVGGINASQTAGIKVQSVAGIDITKPGIALLNYADPLSESIAEWIYYTSIDGTNEFLGAIRGAEKGSAKTHSEGVAIAFPMSELHNNQFADIFHPTATTSLAENVLLKETAAAPTTPAAGYRKIYADTDGKLYDVDDAGNATPIAFEKIVWTTLTDGATITIDLDLNNKYEVELGGNRTLALSNESGKSGKLILVRFIQDGTGSRTLTWFNKASTFATSDVNTGTEIITVGRDIPTTTPIKFSSTTSVPAGLVAGTVYYAIRQSSTTIKVATSVANAQAGTAIDLTSTGTGTHTITTEIRWTSNTAPTLTTGKNRADLIGLILKDVTNGIYEGYVVGQDV